MQIKLYHGLHKRQSNRKILQFTQTIYNTMMKSEKSEVNYD